MWYDAALGDRFVGTSGVFQGWNIFGLVEQVIEVDAIAITNDAAVVWWDLAGVGDWGVEGVSVLDIADGVIASETVYYDSADLGF